LAEPLVPVLLLVMGLMVLLEWEALAVPSPRSSQCPEATFRRESLRVEEVPQAAEMLFGPRGHLQEQLVQALKRSNESQRKFGHQGLRGKNLKISFLLPSG
jgi:hypothetical protein